MALGEFTKQLAQQAILSATSKEPAKESQPASADPMGQVMLAQVAAMQKALKEGEELAISVRDGADAIRVREIYMPTWQVAVVSGVSGQTGFVRIVAPIETLQLAVRVVRAQPGAAPARVAVIAPKT